MTTKERMKKIAEYVETQDRSMPLPVFPNEIETIPTGPIQTLLMEYENTVFDLVVDNINKSPYNTIDGHIKNAEGSAMPVLSLCRNEENDKLTVVNSVVVPTFNNGFRYASYNEETGDVTDIAPMINCCITGGAMQDGPTVLLVPVDNPEAMYDGIHILSELLDVYETRKSDKPTVRKVEPPKKMDDTDKEPKENFNCSHGTDCFNCRLFDCTHNEYMKFHSELRSKK